MKKLKEFFYTGKKVKIWHNAHYEHESAESGKWVTMGDCYWFEFTTVWLYFLGVPIWILSHKCENKGLFEEQEFNKNNNGN
jgi:hypothetical protein